MIIGIDLGGMSAKAAVLKDGVISEKARVATSAADTPEQTARALAELCRQVAEKAGECFDAVEAIGIGSPGVIDSAEGVVVKWTNFFWENVPLAELVASETGKRVFVTNDANAAAFGEAKFGAGKKYRNSVLITLGTGVGSGIVIDGKLFEGFRSAGAELGHTVIYKDGELCTCGRKGCFERYASATALIALTRKAMLAESNSKMWSIAHSVDEADGRTAFDGMRAGDESAKRVIAEYVAGLGEGVANVVNLLRPQAIILGGGISAEKEALLAPLREYVKPRIFVSEEYVPFEIVCAELGNDAGLYGAAQYAADRMK